jgi:hypothetical protein
VKDELVSRRMHMFDSLNEETLRREDATEAPVRHWLRHAGIFLVSMLALGALFVGILSLE